ncbi:MAG: hypothetical protein HYX67_08170, partial [Candidatus Melainabacteria bacterium]|nr:hypothetical protein [Candidatus Melainabacteria bacterium]
MRKSGFGFPWLIMPSGTFAAKFQAWTRAISVCAGVLLSSTASADFSFPYVGKIYQPDGVTALTDTVNLTFTVYNPAQNCILEQEKFSNIDLSLTGGIVNVMLGTGTRTSSDQGLQMTTVISNRPGAMVNVGATGCILGYIPGASDGRFLKIHVDNLTQSTSTDLTPMLSLNSVPMAYEAQQLQGRQASDFIWTQGTVNQNNLSTLTAGNQNADGLHRHDAYVKNGAGNQSFALSSNQTLGLGTVSGSEPTLGSVNAGTVWFNSSTGEIRYFDGTSNVTVVSGGTTGPTGTFVKRDASGNFSAGTITATLNGNASGFTGALTGDVKGTQGATLVSSVSGVSAANVASSVNTVSAANSSNIAGALVKRDGSGNFSAGTITAISFVGSFSGTFSGSGSLPSFSGPLSGDVTGTQGATVVSSLSGVSAASVAASVGVVNASTSLTAANTVVRRDSSGSFSANIITANLNGVANLANSASAVVGPVDTSQFKYGTSAYTGALFFSSDSLGNAFWNQNVSADAAGNMKVGTLAATGIISTSGGIRFPDGSLQTSAVSGVNSASGFTGALTGDVTGTQSATVVSKVGTATASEVVSGVNLANAATAASQANKIVLRDAAGNFSAATITAALNGNAVTATTANYASSANYATSAGSAATAASANYAAVASFATTANFATSAGSASTATTANFATTASFATSAGGFTGSLSGDVTGTQGATVVSNVNVSAINGTLPVSKGGTGNSAAFTLNSLIYANSTSSLASTSGGTISSSGFLSLPFDGFIVGGTEFVTAGGNVGIGTATPSQKLTVAGVIESTVGGVKFPDGSVLTSAVVGSASGFSGALSGDVTGPQGGTVVSKVGTATASEVVSGVNLANAATAASQANKIVLRDAAGNFSAATITGALAGNAATASYASTAGNANTVTTNANLTGPITSAGNATSINSQTGTGTVFVMNTTPALSGATLNGTTTLAGSGVWSSTGRVGIGTPSPLGGLTVSNGVSNVTADPSNVGPKVSFGSTVAGDYMEVGAYGNINQIDTKDRDFRIYSTAAPSAGITLLQGSGNVGIGTTGPASRLDVAGAIAQRGVAAANYDGYLQTNAGQAQDGTLLNPGILIFNGSPGFKYGMDLGMANSRFRSRIFAPDGADISFARLISGAVPTGQGSYTDLMVVRGDSGNVGIGTANPSALLEVAGIVKANTFIGAFSGTFTGTNAGTNANLTGPITSAGNATSIASQTGTGTVFVMDTTPALTGATLRGSTTFSGTGVWNSAGFVGVGTSSPALPIDVNSGGSTTFLRGSYPSGQTLQLAAGSGGAAIVQKGTGPLTFHTNSDGDPNIPSNERVRIENAGNVGIGTSTPVERLDIGTGRLAGGTYSATQRVVFDISRSSGFPAAGFSFPSGGVAQSAEADVIGTGDIFFQAWPSSGAGYGYFETWGGAGTVLGTGNSTPILFRPNRAEAMRITPAGNVGIGTANPSALLEVAGTVKATTFLGAFSGTFTGTNAGTNANLTGPITSAGNATSIASQTGTGTVFVMNTAPSLSGASLAGATMFAGSGTWASDGNVGIGTSSPEYRLDIRNGGAGTGRQNALGIFMGANGADNGASIMLGSSQTVGGYISGFQRTTNSGYLTFGTQAVGYVERMRIDENGYVGIATTNPTSILQVGQGGRLKVSNSVTDYSLFGSIDADGNTNTRVVVSGHDRATYGGNIEYVATANGKHLFYTTDSQTERMRISSNGNVAIGTTATDFPLTVASSGDAQFIVMPTAGDQATLVLGPAPSFGNRDYTSMIRSISNSASNYGSQLAFYTHSNASNFGDPTERLRIDYNGYVGIGTSTPASALHVLGVVTASGFSGPFSGSSGSFSGGISAITGAFSSWVNAGSGQFTSGVSVSTGGLSVSGGGLSVSQGGANIIGGITNSGAAFNNNSEGITNAGSLSGVNNLTASGNGTFGGSITSGGAVTVAASGGGAFYTNDLAGTGYMKLTSYAGGNFIQSGTGPASGSKANLYFTSMHLADIWMTLTSEGRLGIGTTTPAYKLDVNADNLQDGGLRVYGSGNSSGAGDMGLLLSNTGTGGNTWYLDSTNDGSGYGGGKLAFVNGVAGWVRMIIGGDGNVGIGTTTPASRLQVTGGSGNIIVGNGAIATAVDSSIGGIQFANFSGAPQAGIESRINVGGTNNNADLRFYTSLDFSNSYLERMRIDRSGRVGIGTTNPATSLEVYSQINVTTASSGASSLLQLRNTDGGPSIHLWSLGSNYPGGTYFGQNFSSQATLLVTGSSAFTLGTFDTAPLILGTNSTETMRITNGKVGIGTTAPTSALQVAGIVTASGFSGPFSG